MSCVVLELPGVVLAGVVLELPGVVLAGVVLELPGVVLAGVVLELPGVVLELPRVGCCSDGSVDTGAGVVLGSHGCVGKVQEC
jgi:hypothetical protein